MIPIKNSEEALLFYQWRFQPVGGAIFNLQGATNSALIIDAATAAQSGAYSVYVWNAYGSAVSGTAHLAVLSDGANGSRPNQIITRTTPPPQPGQDSLIVITHGWEYRGQDVAWIDQMADAIRNKLSSQGKVNWQVIPIHWENAAFGIPVMAVGGARIVGAVYGAELAQVHWQHVHLIAHSAGSVFIEAFAKEIKAIWPDTEVHCTFLDPYVSIVWGLGKQTYGQNADWSDCYAASDTTGVLTRGPLVHAHNVDVSALDPQPTHLPFGIVLSSHGWPYQFYYDTVVSGVLAGTGDYGFPLSKEADGWDKIGNYQMGLPPVVLPVARPSVPIQPDLPLRSANLALNDLPHATSSSGASVVGNGMFTLSAAQSQSVSASARASRIHPLEAVAPNGSPAWLAVALTVTNAVNFVQFDAAFTDTNAAQGLLTVYWNTNQICIVDERVASTYLQTYRFPLPGTVTEGVYTLSFRLDAFSSLSSSIAVTNMAAGFAGITEPIKLDMLLAGTNSKPVIKLTGATNFSYLVESSTNLIDWTPTALLVNTNGTVLFADPANNSSSRFYRALLP